MSDNLLLVEYYAEFGRMGHIEGLFVCTEQQYQKALGREVDWGEILGKHSEIYHTLSESDLVIKSRDQGAIDAICQLLGRTSTISGYNPIAQLEESDIGR